MNKTYKLKYTKTSNTPIVVSELATNAIACINSVTTSNNQPATQVQTTASSQNFLKNSLQQLSQLSRYSFLLGFGFFGINTAYALDGATVVNGNANIVVNGSTTSITTSPNTIINWQSFDIKADEIVNFIQNSASDAVLNRVVGSQISEILGTLKSNGRVFLLNPNGIVFGQGAVVDTQGLVASTLNLSDDNFKAGRNLFEQDKAKAIATILNQGLLKVNDDGTIALIGGNVVNNGIIENRDGNVYLLAGQTIQIADFNNPQVTFKVVAGNRAVNLGSIVANNATVLAHQVAVGHDSRATMFSDLYNQEQASATKSRISANGTIEIYGASVASELQNTTQNNLQVSGERSSLALINGELNVSQPTGTAGNIKVIADKVHLSNQAQLLASGVTGGNINIGGDRKGTGDLKLARQTVIEADALINVAANHDAGSAIVWGDVAFVNGNFVGTSTSGQGAFIETSGKNLNLLNLTVNTTSLRGRNFFGTWLLDPTSIHVVNSSSYLNNNPEEKTEGNDIIFTGTDYYDSNSNHQPSILQNTNLTEKLKTNNVVLLAEESIYLNSVTIEGTNDHSLTLKSKYINVESLNNVVNVSKLVIDTSTQTGKTQRGFFGNNFTFNGKVFEAKGGGHLGLGNSVINATENIDIKADSIYFSLSDLKTPTINLESNKDGNGVKLEHARVNVTNFKINGLGNGNSELIGGYINATNIEVLGKGINLDSANLTSTTSLKIATNREDDSSVTIKNSKIHTNGFNPTVTSNQASITVQGGYITSTSDDKPNTCYTISSKTGDIAVNDFNFNNTKLFDVKTGGNITFDKGSYTGGTVKDAQVLLNASGDVTVTGVAFNTGIKEQNITTTGVGKTVTLDSVAATDVAT